LQKEVLETAEWDKRKQAVELFNGNNRWKKRGIAYVPVKFGMSFTAKFMNQAGALVHVYTDGSVLVSHGGTEMGQVINFLINQEQLFNTFL
jgi:xanthine dehydrogenase/oxidase